MLALVIYAIVVALATAFVLMLVNKWRWLEWAQVHSVGFLYKLLTCHFCTTFWVTMAVTAVLAGVTGDWMALLSPILATPIAVRLW